MLIEFTVGNFRSIAGKVTLSMIAAPIKSGSHATTLDRQNIIPINNELSLLKTIAIYGANASGKSNVIRALRVMTFYIMESIIFDLGAFDVYAPCLVKENYETKPSYFEIIFLIDGIQYRYGFEASATEVIKEWLYFVPTIREAVLFERGKKGIKIGDYFKDARGLEKRVTEGALFLTVAKEFNVIMARKIFQWVDDFLLMYENEEMDNRHTLKYIENEKQSEAVIDFIRQLDLGISGIEISEREEIETLHTLYDENGQQTGVVRLNMRLHESAGTRKLFTMAGKIVTVLKGGSILAIDEIDAKLHPSLTRRIIELFHNPRTNPKNAQLIFATHDTNLLDNKLMRRDQIWFTEKDRTGATDLYSLVELKQGKVRNDADYEKNYIDGRYGAIPFPGGFESIFAEPEVVNATEE